VGGPQFHAVGSAARGATARVALSQALAPWRKTLAVVDGSGLGDAALNQERGGGAVRGSDLQGAASAQDKGQRSWKMGLAAATSLGCLPAGCTYG
jgi:hypothetical protein